MQIFALYLPITNLYCKEILHFRSIPYSLYIMPIAKWGNMLCLYNLKGLIQPCKPRFKFIAFDRTISVEIFDICCKLRIKAISSYFHTYYIRFVICVYYTKYLIYISTMPFQNFLHRKGVHTNRIFHERFNYLLYLSVANT